VYSQPWSTAGGALALAIFAAIGGGAVEAQSAAGVSPATANVEVDPIKCWWRTTAGAVRVGEPFGIVLTCAVIENELNVVVPDQSRLEPAAMQLAPFEVMGGTHFSDSRTTDRRFFQYEYLARLIQEDAFGRDTPLPDFDIKYRIRTRTPDGSSVEGRELTYILPPISIRTLSLVPGDASDIRDATSETFGGLDAQAFQANLLRVAAVVLFSLGTVMAMLVVVRPGRRLFGREDTTRQPKSDAVVLRRAGRELAALQQLREHEGWSEALAGRAMTALRIVGTYALAGRAIQIVAPRTTNSHAGHMAMRGDRLQDTQILVSGSITAATVAEALASTEPGSQRHARLEHLQTALARFVAIQYGRSGNSIDEAAADQSLEHGLAMARRLSVQHLWPVRKLNALTGRATELGRRVWSR
jgi:hypothetical protein